MPTISECTASPWLISTSNQGVGNCGFAGASYAHRNWQDAYLGILHWVYVPFHGDQMRDNQNIPAHDFRVWTWGDEYSFFTDEATEDYSPNYAIFLDTNYTF